MCLLLKQIIETCFKLIKRIKKFQTTNEKSIGGGDRKLAIIPIPKDKHRTTLIKSILSVINEINVKKIDNCLASFSCFRNSIGTILKGIMSGFESEANTIHSIILKVPNKMVKIVSKYLVFK